MVFDVMGVLLVLAAVVMIALFVNNKEKKERKEVESSGDTKAAQTNDSTAVSDNMFSAKDTLLAALKRMGCQYEVDEEDHSVRFDWQGGHFCAYVDNDSPFVSLWFFQWNEWELYDIDTLSRVKRVINENNVHMPATVVYSVNENAGTFSIHSNMYFLLVPQIPEIDNYLQSLFARFFQTCRYFDTELEKLTSKEENATP